MRVKTFEWIRCKELKSLRKSCFAVYYSSFFSLLKRSDFIFIGIWTFMCWLYTDDNPRAFFNRIASLTVILKIASFIEFPKLHVLLQPLNSNFLKCELHKFNVLLKRTKENSCLSFANLKFQYLCFNWTFIFIPLLHLQTRIVTRR